MADIEPPSFSLGLDLDADTDTHRLEEQLTPPPVPGSHSISKDEGDSVREVYDSGDDEEDVGLTVMDSEPESDPPRALKRLRRGLRIDESGAYNKGREAETKGVDSGDDDIEEFSSQEGFVNADGNISTHLNPIFSSSKPSLRGSGILSTQSSSLLKAEKKDRAFDAPALSSMGKDRSGLVFPKLTVSPLRRFQLIDSDSDSDSKASSISGNLSGRAPKEFSAPKDHQPTLSDKSAKVLAEKHLDKDLWKEFCSTKNFHIATPVLDEVCDEYFQSVKENDAAHKLGSNACTDDRVKYCQNGSSTERCWDLPNPVPPAHRYFFHTDPRVQRLVRCRLPNFFPLGIDSNSASHLPTDSVIDYTCQFNGEASKQKGTRRNSSGKSKTTVRKTSRKSNAREDASQGWVDPKSSNTIPRDAGKRRVVANGQAAGHWYTSPEGRKVYVSSSGQELTGQAAYRYYKKENGGFKSRKKTNAKKKKG